MKDRAPERRPGEHDRGDHADRGERRERAAAGRDAAAEERRRAEHERDREEADERALQRAVLEGVREAAGGGKRGVHQPLEREPRGPAGRHVQVQVVLALQRPVDRRTADGRQDAQAERGGEAVPYGERVLGRRAGEDRPRRRVDERRHGQRRRHPDRQAHGREDLDRHLHEPRRLVRRPREVARLAVEEDVVDEPGRVRHAERPAREHRARRERAEQAEAAQIERLGEEHLLRQEAVQQRHPGHRRGRDDRERRGVRHVPSTGR